MKLSYNDYMLISLGYTYNQKGKNLQAILTLWIVAHKKQSNNNSSDSDSRILNI